MIGTINELPRSIQHIQVYFSTRLKCTRVSRPILKNIKSSTLLIFGDGNINKPEHEVEMFRLLGGGNAGDIYQLPNEELAILPAQLMLQYLSI